MKTFEFTNNINCCFSVEHYFNYPKAIAITVIDSETDNELATLTVLDNASDYEVGIATISDDSMYGDEVFGYKSAREILTELGIIEKVWITYSFDDGTGEEISADVCTIDLYRLKEYSKTWNYCMLKDKKETLE